MMSFPVTSAHALAAVVFAGVVAVIGVAVVVWVASAGGDAEISLSGLVLCGLCGLVLPAALPAHPVTSMKAAVDAAAIV